MVCPYCQSSTQVINSRPSKRTGTVWRRRRCLSCHAVFTTNEHIDLSTILMIEQPNSKLQPFEQALLFVSIYECCKHLPNPAAIAQELTHTVITQLLKIGAATITRNTIIETATPILNRFDNAAGVQYRAFHPVTSKE